MKINTQELDSKFEKEFIDRISKCLITKRKGNVTFEHSHIWFILYEKETNTAYINRYFWNPINWYLHEEGVDFFNRMFYKHLKSRFNISFNNVIGSYLYNY